MLRTDWQHDGMPGTAAGVKRTTPPTTGSDGTPFMAGHVQVLECLCCGLRLVAGRTEEDYEAAADAGCPSCKVRSLFPGGYEPAARWEAA